MVKPPVVIPPVVVPVVTPPVVTPAASIDARAGINALAINGQSGPAKESFGGLGYLYPGNYVQYNSINFGSGVTKVTIQLAVSPDAPISGSTCVWMASKER